MKKILLSSFFIGFCMMAMAQAKTPAKTNSTPPKRMMLQAAIHPEAGNVAYKKKMIAEAGKENAPTGTAAKVPMTPEQMKAYKIKTEAAATKN